MGVEEDIIVKLSTHGDGKIQSIPNGQDRDECFATQSEWSETGNTMVIKGKYVYVENGPHQSFWGVMLVSEDKVVLLVHRLNLILTCITPVIS